MPQEMIFAPMGAMALLTFAVLLFIPLRRFRAGFAGEVGTEDFKFGESARVPGHVAIPNRNYMNLLELPVLFYVACIVLYVTAKVDAVALGLAWAFVALRIAHSAVHLTYNRVLHRFRIFALSVFVLLALWTWIAFVV